MRMSDELDPALLQLFAQKRARLPDREFLSTLLANIERRQRAAWRRQAAVIAGVLLILGWQVPNLLRATAEAAQFLSAQTADYAPLILSPWGWAVSMLVGLGVILRMTPIRR
jgi:hypothetical protein